MRYARFLVIVLFLTLTASASTPAEGDRQELLARQKLAAERIEALKREQELLLFQKAMYEADSKYLMLDLSSGKGQLKYRNRILKTFSAKLRRSVPAGPLVLTEKRDGSQAKRALVFGDRLVMIGKEGSVGRSKAPQVVLGSKEMAALFYILEPGAPLFIMK